MHYKKHWVYGRDINREEVLEEMGDSSNVLRLMIRMDVEDADVYGNNPSFASAIRMASRKYDGSRCDKVPA